MELIGHAHAQPCREVPPEPPVAQPRLRLAIQAGTVSVGRAPATEVELGLGFSHRGALTHGLVALGLRLVVKVL